MNSDEAPEIVEAVIARIPFTVLRQVRWFDCDPAGVVFAGRYLLSAGHLFRNHVLGIAARMPGSETEFDAPAKSYELVFLLPLWPGERFEMVVYADVPHTHTTHLLVLARRADTAEPVFTGRLSTIYVDPLNRRRKVRVPETVRQPFEAYRAKAGPLPEHLATLARRRPQ